MDCLRPASRPLHLLFLLPEHSSPESHRTSHWALPGLWSHVTFWRPSQVVSPQRAPSHPSLFLPAFCILCRLPPTLPRRSRLQERWMLLAHPLPITRSVPAHGRQLVFVD